MTIRNKIFGIFMSIPELPEMPLVRFESDSDKLQAIKNYTEAVDRLKEAKGGIDYQDTIAGKNRLEVEVEQINEYIEKVAEVIALNFDDKSFQRKMISVYPEIVVNFTKNKDLMEMALKNKPSVIKLLPEDIKNQDSMGDFFINNSIRSIGLLPEKFRDSPTFMYKAYLKAKELKMDEWETQNPKTVVQKSVGPRLIRVVATGHDFEKSLKELSEREIAGANLFKGLSKSAFSNNRETSWVDTFIKQ